MLTAKLIASAYLLFALGVAWLIAHWCFPDARSWLNRVGLSWCIVTISMLFVRQPALFFACIVLLLLSVAPKPPLPRVAYFLAILPAVPDIGIAWVIPFPGLQSLYTLSYVDALAATLLAPIVLAKRSPTVPPSPLSNDVQRAIKYALAFVVLCAILDFRLTTTTNGLRMAVGHFLRHALIILALGRVITHPGAFPILARGILVSCIFMMAIGFAQGVTGWFLYSEIPGSLKLYALRYDLVMYQRSGYVRTFGTEGPIPHGLYMAMAAMLCMFFSYKQRSLHLSKSSLLFLFLAPVFLFAMIRTGSRGAFLMMATSIFVACLFHPSVRSLRSWVIGPAIVVFGLAMFLSGHLMNLLEAEEHGTFMYRWNLVLNSMDSISKHPWLGTPDFLNNPFLELSRQGEHLIDIVNTYLQKILRYGVLGLFLFIAPLWISARAMFGCRRIYELQGQWAEERYARIVLALLIGFAVAIGTVSLVARLPQYYWIVIFLALCLSCSTNLKVRVQNNKARIR